jgi:N-acylneuraminate cytidylyltransferase
VKVAIIPARGGSKRIPRKNIRPFAGKPMIAHSIDCAVRSGVFDRIIVSTDDAQIAEVARGYGAEVPFVRPPELSNDHAGTTAVIAHAVDCLQRLGVEVSAACCIYATAPFVRASDLQKALRVLEAGEWLYVFAVTSYAFPIFRSVRMDAEQRVEMFFPEQFPTRSQDLPEALHDAGQFYWGRPHAWLSSARIFDRHSTAITIPRWRVQDIDTEEDWQRAELISRYLETQGE